MPLVNVAVGVFMLLKVAPLPEVVIVHLPVCPAAGVLAARAAVLTLRESWSGPAVAAVAGNAIEICRVSAVVPQALVRVYRKL